MSTPEPGIHEGVSFEDYIDWHALANSRMGALLKSEKHFKYATPVEPTKSLRIGSLVHSGRLEPLEIGRRYAVMPAFNLDEENKTLSGGQSENWGTAYCKARAKEWSAQNGDKEIVKADEYERMTQIVGSLAADESANHLFNSPGPVELSMLWQDDETGILCKARVDKVSTYGLVDLKTTADICNFPKTIANYGYHRQLAHYVAGYAALTGEIVDAWICAVESASPYCVQTAQVDPEALAEGERERRRLLRLLADCLQRDEWPGPPAPATWKLPEWAMDRGPIELTHHGEPVTL